MFEAGTDQASGLRLDPVAFGPALMPVASPSQPARAYELLCHLALQLKAIGRLPVILDGNVMETTVSRRSVDLSPNGLQHALLGGGVSGLGHPGDGHEWLVMPSAMGLRALQQTALTAGGAMALSRLLAPFAPGSLLLLFAPAHELAPLLSGLGIRVMVPVLPFPQASIDAYGAVKQVHMAGALPVLAPMASPDADGSLEQVMDSVTDCALRHLGLDMEIWSEPLRAACVQECALGALRHDGFHGPSDPRFAGMGGSSFSGAAPTLWS